jgi:hypothetical protein
MSPSEAFRQMDHIAPPTGLARMTDDLTFLRLMQTLPSNDGLTEAPH